jgi:hypothetical protein
MGLCNSPAVSPGAPAATAVSVADPATAVSVADRATAVSVADRATAAGASISGVLGTAAKAAVDVLSEMGGRLFSLAQG